MNFTKKMSYKRLEANILRFLSSAFLFQAYKCVFFSGTCHCHLTFPKVSIQSEVAIQFKHASLFRGIIKQVRVQSACKEKRPKKKKKPPKKPKKNKQKTKPKNPLRLSNLIERNSIEENSDFFFNPTYTLESPEKLKTS